MSNVTLRIAGRDYVVACAAGEESQVREYGAMIDGKLGELGATGGQGETRNLLFAALLLADELAELRRAAASTTAAVATATAPDSGDSDSGTFEAVAARLEAVADALENGLHNA